MKLNESYIEYEIIQDDMVVVGSNSKEEIHKYVWQYVEDGDVEVWEIKRTLIAKASSSASLRKGKK